MFVKGIDISLLKRIVDAGGVYKEFGQARNALEIFAGHGINYVRLRLFHEPDKKGAQVNDLSYTLELAKQIKAYGFSFLLNMHYSDTWADPGKQITPAAWRNLSFEELCEKVYDYTNKTVSAFRSNNCQPDMVQIGNEVTPGMLWEYGRVAGDRDTSKLRWIQETGKMDLAKSRWQRFAKLLNSAIRGATEASDSVAIKTIIHIDRGGDTESCKWFFDNLFSQKVDFDSIGLSYYPFWHGPIENLKENLVFLSKEYKKNIYIVETAFPYKSEQFYEEAIMSNYTNIGREFPYELSKDGQYSFLNDVFDAVKKCSCGKGVFYWAPEWIEIKDYQDESDAQACWARALFDDKGDVLPAIKAFDE